MIHGVRNKAGFGLEAGQDVGGIQPSCPPASHGEEDHHPVYNVNAFGPTIESLVADIVQVTTAFWPRQTASHVPHT